MDVISNVFKSNITRNIICTIIILVSGIYILKKVTKKDTEKDSKKVTKKDTYYDAAFINNKGIRVYKGDSTEPIEIPITPTNLLPGTALFTDFLEQSKTSINLCFYGITSKTIVNSVLEQKKKGVKVNLIVDNSGVKNEQVVRMRSHGVRVYTNRKHEQGSLMHHKFIIIDDSDVLITSMNPTTSAFCGNFENIITTNDEELVSQYLHQYEVMKIDVISFENVYNLNRLQMKMVTPILQPIDINMALNSSKRYKIYLFADSHGRECAQLLINFLPFNCQVFSLFKPNAILESVISEIEKMTEELTEDDFVVIFGGVNNILKNCSILNTTIERISKIAYKLNVIFFSIPFWFGRHDLDWVIRETNVNMCKKLCLLDKLFFIDPNQFLTKHDYTQHGLHLMQSGKKKLMTLVVNIVKNTHFS